MNNKRYMKSNIQPLNKIINTDLIETNINDGKIKDLLLKNKLISTRMGNVESSFILKYVFKHKVPDYNDIMDHDIDYFMKRNAGLYYKDSNRKNEILKWWASQTIDMIKNSALITMHQGFDLILWAHLNLKNTYSRWDGLDKLILQNSGNKKILYIGNATKSIKTAYERGVQNAWKFDIPSFSMYYIKTPQTTLNMEYPNESIKETTYDIVDEIINNYSDFDTAILGCGAYGPPIMNILRKKLKNKNMIYLGSMCYQMFGIYSKGMAIPNNDDVIRENWILVQEECEEKCKEIDQAKYWK
jgi:hypothetical protein